MPTTTLKKVLDLKIWQSCAPAPVTNAANMFTIDTDGPDQLIYYVTSATAVYVYDPNEDAWGLLPSPALATFAAGASGRWHNSGPTGTASVGSTITTLNTNQTIQVDLSARNGISFKVRITGGTGAGQQRSIVSASIGTNSIITVDSAWGVTPDGTSTYTLYTGRVYIMGGGVTAAGSFKYWDHATQTWSGNLVVTGFPTFGTDARMVAPSSIKGGIAFTGTATSGSATTLVVAGKTWAVNQFANWQVRITAGTGAGGIRAIASNTATTLTINSSTALDATSAYSIEPSDDYIYIIGNAAVAAYRYQISTTTWTTLAPGAARAGAPGAGASLHWVTGCTTPSWSAESTVINGNRLYSFRSTNVLDYYDIAANTWVSGVAYARQNETVAASGAGWSYDGGNFLYAQLPQVIATPTRFLRFDFRGPIMEGWSVNVFPSPTAATLGDKVNGATYSDGVGIPIRWNYMLQPGGVQMHRCLVW